MDTANDAGFIINRIKRIVSGAARTCSFLARFGGFSYGESMKQFILKMKAGDLFFEGHCTNMSVKITPYRYSAARFGTEEFTTMHCDIINRALPGLDFEVQPFVSEEEREPLPASVYYRKDINRLVDPGGYQFSHSFQTQWYERREEFPLYHTQK